MLSHSSKSNFEQIKDLKAMALDFPQATLDLRPHALFLTDELLIPILRNAHRFLRSLTLDNCRLLTEKIPYHIATICPEILDLSTQSMPWKKWSTWGFFSDVTFPKLQTLSVANCTQLKELWLLAPELQNHHTVAKEIIETMYQHLIFGKNHIYTSYHSVLMPPQEVSFTINQVKIKPVQLLQDQLSYALHGNQLTELVLHRDLSGVPNESLATIAKHLTHATSLTHLDLSKKNIDFKALNPVLASLNSTLETLDISQNNLIGVSHKGEQLLRILKLHPKLKTLNLDDNHLQNEDITYISENLAKNKTLTELHLSDNPFDRLDGLTKAFQDGSRLKKLYLTGNAFPGFWLNPFLEALENNTTLESLEITTVSSDWILQSFGKLLNKNATLQILHITNKRFTDNDIKNGFNITPFGMKNYVEALAQNKTLTSLALSNTLMTEDCLPILAEGIKLNNTIIDFTFTIDKILSDQKDYVSRYEHHMENIKAHIHQNSVMTIQSEIKLNEFKTLSLEFSLDKEIKEFSDIIPDLEIKTSEMKLLPSTQQDLLKQLLEIKNHLYRLDNQVAYLTARSDILDYELDRDPEAKREKEIIRSDRRLYDYYHKICQLAFYFRASECIATLWIEQRDDIEDMLIQGASAIGKSVLNFIPVVSGLSCVIDGLEKLHHFKHDVTKYRRAVQLSQWGQGLGVSGCERLCYRFARKLAIEKQKSILNPDSTINDMHKKLWEKFKIKLNDVSSYLSQSYREWKEEHVYSIQEKMALIDLFKIIEGIAKKSFVKPIIKDEQKAMEKQISLMLDYVLDTRIPLSILAEQDTRLLLSAKSIVALGMWSSTQPLVFPSSEQKTYSPPSRGLSPF